MSRIDVDYIKNDFDWKECFKYAEGFTVDDIREVLFALDGDNDGPEWLGGFILKDERYAVLRAGCDYTGWG